jgi:hypothetical protein
MREAEWVGKVDDILDDNDDNYMDEFVSDIESEINRKRLLLPDWNPPD